METDMKDSKEKGKLFTTQNLVLAGMFAAIMAVISQLSIPMPGGVPITIQVFGIALIGAILGWKLGFFAVLIYILVGAAGLPVFHNFTGGIQSLVGLTGGYILSWPIMVVFCGIHPFPEKKGLSLVSELVLAVTGLMIVEFIGAVQWAFLSSEKTLPAIMIYSFAAFIPKDILITVLGVLIGKQIKKPMTKAGLL